MYEYRVVQHEGDPMTLSSLRGGFQELLNSEAADGWDCFSVLGGFSPYPKLFVLFLRRPTDFRKPQVDPA